MLSSDLVRRVLDSAPDALIIIDRAGEIVFANQQIEALFGYSPADLLGQKVEILLPERFRTRHVGHRQGYSRTERIRPMGSGLDLFARRRDGTEFPVEISLSPAHEGEEALAVAAIRDITDRREIQEALREAREIADRANQAKSRFLATASHDLRQPLQALSLLNGTLRRMVREPTICEALEGQEQAISAMSKLLNALLDISKLESGAIKPEISDFTVAALFDEMRLEFATLAGNKGLDLEVESCREHVHSDPALVGQVIRNLVANAIKYTGQGGVRLRCAHDADLVKLQVIDTGVGIPKSELARIYDDFYQIGVSANTSRDGYGLGLSIVARIVALLGVKLDVESERGRGTVFTLALPASEHQLDSARPTVPLKRPSPASKDEHIPILLVEDDARVRNATRLLLKVEGYDVTTAASLAEAVEVVGKQPGIRLLVTDYHLGDDFTGVQVISRVREVIGWTLPAILVTGDTSSAIRDLHGDTLLRTASKPIDPDQLLALIRELSSIPPNHAHA